MGKTPKVQRTGRLDLATGYIIHADTIALKQTARETKHASDRWLVDIYYNTKTEDVYPHGHVGNSELAFREPGWIYVTTVDHPYTSEQILDEIWIACAKRGLLRRAGH